MQNIFSKLSTIDFNKRFNVLLSKTTVPKIKTLVFIEVENGKYFQANTLRAFIESSFGSGYWLINITLHSTKYLSDKKPFIFGFIHNSELILINYTWENESIKEIKRTIIKPDDHLSYEIPFFSDGIYVSEGSNCDLFFKDDLICTPKAYGIIKKANESADIILGTTPEEYLREVPLKAGASTLGYCHRMNACIDLIYESYSEKTIRKNISIIDFEKISGNKNLSEKFILEYMDKLDMKEVYRNIRLSESFLKENFDKLNKRRYIFQHQRLSENFIESIIHTLSPFDWEIISARQKLSENFIRKYQDFINWDAVSNSQKLSMNFIREFQDKVNWNNISYSQNLNMKFIKEFQDKIDLRRINRQKLSKNFILKNIEKLDLYWISRGQEHLSDKLRDKLLLLSYLT